jgi:hypothetical protein
MAGGRDLTRGAYGWPRVRQRGLPAEASTIKRPEITVPVAFTGLPARKHLWLTAVLVRCGRLRRGLLDALPDRAFFHEPFEGFGPGALARLLCHGFNDFLAVFGRVVELLRHFWLLFSLKDRWPSAPGTLR